MAVLPQKRLMAFINRDTRSQLGYEVMRVGSLAKISTHYRNEISMPITIKNQYHKLRAKETQCKYSAKHGRYLLAK